MDFAPKSDDDINRELCLPPGTYDFEVVKAAEGESKKGHPMISLELRVYNGQGGALLLRDWLLSHHPMCLRKLLHFCDTTGLREEYDAGSVGAFQMEGRSGQCVIKNVESDQYGLQAQIDDYKVAKPGEPVTKKGPSGVPAAQQDAARAHAAAIGDDDIPF